APVSVLARNRWGWVSDRVAIWVACTFALIGIMEALAIINLLKRALIIVAPPTREAATSAPPPVTFANGSPAGSTPATRLEPAPPPAANAPRPSTPAGAP